MTENNGNSPKLANLEMSIGLYTNFFIRQKVTE